MVMGKSAGAFILGSWKQEVGFDEIGELPISPV
jgi:hypothetical protein